MRTTGRIAVAVALLVVVFAIANGVRKQRLAQAPPAPANVGAPATQPQAPPQPAQPKQRMVVAFKIDPDLMRGSFLGERWVSPPTFAFAQPGKQYTTHAKLQTVNDDGTRTDLSGDWSTSDPNMIAISHDQAGQVTIVVREPGEGQLVAAAGGQRKVLQVRATRTDDAMEVAFVQ
ncbi:hypothetical protein [Noviluteimonas gilva]|uniref:Uncharacterized protein n=1 Tax=Noviluteimonas gilva TaxID=2682097 RepID=A0A7C9M4U6_9GAMM|nr:hypothetical protein [Lysobacter gilvus]MUV14962.1 hypothetical protein [Lysobacter gilvus]